MKRHPVLFLRDNKKWFIKFALLLFSFITIIIYFIEYGEVAVKRFTQCPTIHPLLLSFGLLSVLFFSSSSVIIFLQWRRRNENTSGYAQLQTRNESNENNEKNNEEGRGGLEKTEDDDLHERKKEEGEEGEGEGEEVGIARKIKEALKVSSFTLTLATSILLLFFLISYSVLVHETTPQLNGNLRLKGLHADVLIEREPNGVIHIVATSDHDVYFGQGVAMAQERLWEMEFFRRLANGSLSEVLGNSTLEVDMLFRTLGFRGASEASLPYLSEDTRLAATAFVEGVNSYLDTNPKLPAEFRLLGVKPLPYSLADSLMMVKILSYELSGNYVRELLYHQLKFSLGLSEEEISKLNPEYPASAPTILSEDDIKHINFTYHFDPIDSIRTIYNKQERANNDEYQSIKEKISVHDLIKQSGVLKGLNLGFKSASNNWVVGGSRTTSGKPLLCNDPHLTISAPSIWVLMHLESPNISVVGATPVGAPGITLGRNADIAWGVTNTFVDVQDLYLLEMDEEQKSYKHNSTWYNFEYRTEVIKIKGEEDYILTVRESLYGPVVSDILDTQGQTAALRWVSLDDNDTTFNSITQLVRAKNFTDFRNALRQLVGPAQNFIFADIHGNIGYQCPGKIPARVEGHTGMYPVPGNGSYDWLGWIPFDELPYVYNPSKGYIVSANNKITPPSYPYLLLNNHDWEEHYRALSITELVKSTNNHTVKTMKDIQSNTVTGLWYDFKPYLKNLPDNLLDDQGQKWKNKMLTWDGNMTPDSQHATVFEYWFYYMGKLGEESGYYSWMYPYFILNSLANNSCDGSECVHFIASTFSQAVTVARDRPWGSVHKLFVEHPVMSNSPLACVYDREIKTGGDTYTINLGAYNSRFEEETMNPFDSFHGPSYRQIVDLADMQGSQFMIPMGNSGNVLDKNYDNMLRDFFDGKYVNMRTSNYRVDNRLTLK